MVRLGGQRRRVAEFRGSLAQGDERRVAAPKVHPEGVEMQASPGEVLPETGKREVGARRTCDPVVED